MLASVNRINQEKEIKKIFSRGRFFKGKYVNLKFIIESFNSNPRAAVIISKKVHSHATVRNKIKRQISNIIFENLSKTKPNAKIIFIVKRVPEDFQDLKVDIDQCLNKGNLYLK